MSDFGGFCGAAISLVTYLWISFYAWSFLDTRGNPWWSFPAGVTTFVVGVAFVLAGIALGIYIGMKIEDRAQL